MVQPLLMHHGTVGRAVILRKILTFSQAMMVVFNATRSFYNINSLDIHFCNLLKETCLIGFEREKMVLYTATDGFIFKGPGEAQNYTFTGSPNDGELKQE